MESELQPRYVFHGKIRFSSKGYIKNSPCSVSDDPWSDGRIFQRQKAFAVRRNEKAVESEKTKSTWVEKNKNKFTLLLFKAKNEIVLTNSSALAVHDRQVRQRTVLLVVGWQRYLHDFRRVLSKSRRAYRVVRKFLRRLLSV